MFELTETKIKKWSAEAFNASVEDIRLKIKR